MTLRQLLEQNQEIEIIFYPNGNRGWGKIFYRNISNLKRYMNYKVHAINKTKCWISR